MFKRKIYDKLLEWKAESDGNTALLLEGARRIGKSTVVEAFAKNEYESYILIDFSIASKGVRDLFEDISDLNYFFLQLQLLYHVDLVERKSVIIFDEVQLCPLARQAIKHLVKDHRYDYIETGSLISIKKNVKNILIPSEERRINMYPMDYEEFLWAIGDHASYPLIKRCFDQGVSLGQKTNRMLLRNFRLYMLVGGMPQAVSEYLNTKNLRSVDMVKRKILKLYFDDFRKIDKTGKLGRLFQAIPTMLSHGVGRFYPTAIIKGVGADKMEDLLIALEDSKTVNISYQADDPNIGLPLNEDKSRMKIYVGDTGLMVTLAFWDKSFAENVIYDKLLADRLQANMGYIYENLVAQMLKSSGSNLYFHTWPKDEKHNYEIDFLLSRGAMICPIEVKSASYKSHVSLDAFCRKFSSRVGNRYVVYTKDLRHDGETTLLPIYMVGLI